MSEEFLSESQLTEAAGILGVERHIAQGRSGTKILINGQVQDLSQKTIVSIPGWKDLVTGSKKASGIHAYSKSPWANRCISIRMDAIGRLDWEIVDENDEAVEGELTDLLEEANLSDLLKLVEADLLIHGQAFILIAHPKGGGKAVVGLRRLNASTMKVIANAQGISRFEQVIDGTHTPFETDDIIYFHTFNPEDDTQGVSLVSVCEPSIESEYNADQYLAAFFKNFALPPVIFTTESDMPEPEEKRLTAWWNRLFAGVSNQHKTGFLGRGLKPELVGYSPDKLALETIRAEARRNICATFGVPPAVAGAWEAANYATSKEQVQSLYEETVFPRAEMLADIITEQLIALFNPSLRFRFMTETLNVVQEDLNKKAERIAALVTAGVIKAEAGAEELGYAPEQAGTGPQQAPSFQPNPFSQPPEEELAAKATRTSSLGIGGEAASIEAMPDIEEPDALTEELGKWNKKVVKRIKAGKSAGIEFVSTVIPNTMYQAVKAQLEVAETLEDVARVFADAERWKGYPS